MSNERRICFEPEGKEKGIVVSSIGRSLNVSFFLFIDELIFNFTYFPSIFPLLLFYTCMAPLFGNDTEKKSAQGKIHNILLTLF